MTAHLPPASLNPIYPLFIAASVALGWSMPGFYEWTGSDQSRPSPLVGRFALGMTIAGVAACLLLPWLPIKQTQPELGGRGQSRFNLRSLLGVTTGIAIGVAGLARFPMLLSSLAYGIALIHFVWFAVRAPRRRWPAASLAACMYFPFVWVFGYDDSGNLLRAILSLAAGLPMLLPSALLSSWTGRRPLEFGWLPLLMAAAELFVGTWIISLGPKRTIAYLVFVALVSLFSSFCFLALVLA